MKTAVIGMGRIGTTVATLLAGGGQEVVVADRKPDKAVALAAKLGGSVTSADIEDAIRTTDVVVPTIIFAALPEFVSAYAEQLAGKILIDPTNPVSFDERGPIARLVGDNESGGQVLAAQLPGSIAYAKAFGTLGADTLTDAADARPRAVLFYVTDDDTAASAVEELVTAAGYTPVRAGGIDRAADIELQGALHQYGGLGRTVTAAEAAELVRRRHFTPN
ncbi:NAD(P)-binding domain-containing protein [Nocardia sp. NPDC050378]|uniref:NADPH-dependent F420 reductase n=1 Tax=Nocardia sp. NPDC050378 TaxID=3155400 RepID=UPI0033EAEA9C